MHFDKENEYTDLFAESSENYFRNIDYNSTDTAYDFHMGEEKIRLLFGAVGTGKSVSSMMEIYRRGVEQEPGSDGVRRSRFAIIRNTYPELVSTTLATWLTWFPEEDYGKVRRDSPITHTLRFDDVHMEVLFLACDNESDIKKLKSLECTGIYVNELQFMDVALFKEAMRRIDRYPPKIYGVPATWAGVIADANPPTTRHWMYKFFEIDKPANAKTYKFPPALLVVDNIPSGNDHAVSLDGTIYINNPAADYIRVQNNPRYWLNQVPAAYDEEIKVNCQGEYGFTKQGKPVHPEYRDSLHFSTKIFKASSSVTLDMGWDFGNTPAVAIGQLNARGQLLIMHEFYCEDSSLDPFVANIVVPFLDRTYPWWRENHRSFHDPAGSDGSQTDGISCQQILKKHGIKSQRAAASNAPTQRRNGIKKFMTKLVDGQPAFMLSNVISLLREALMGGYCYAKINNSVVSEVKYHDKPLKNMYSHITEACEYLAMNCCEPPIKKPKPQPKHVTNWAAY